MGGTHLPERGNFVIRGGHVLSMDSSIGDLPAADVLVRDGVIVSVGSRVETEPGTEVIDASGMIVLPGFIDTHWHLWNTSLRAFMKADDPAFGYFPITVRFGPHFQPEDTYAATRLGLAEAVLSGVTTVHEWSHNVRGPQWADASLRAFMDAGLRGRFSYGWAQQSDMTKGMDVAGIAATQREWFADPARHEHMLQLGIASRNLVQGQSLRGSISMELAQLDWGAARELGIPITLHANPRGLVTSLEREGLLGRDVVLVHPMFLTAEECQISAERGVVWSMSTVGESGWTLGWGADQAIKFHELEQAGGRTALSTDASCFEGANFFAAMRAMYRSHVNRLGPDTAITWRRMLELATIDGARALDIADVTGSLTPGKRADILLLSRGMINVAPAGDPIMEVTLLGEPENVRTVIADGRILMRDRQFVAMDADEVVARAAESTRALAARESAA